MGNARAASALLPLFGLLLAAAAGAPAKAQMLGPLMSQMAGPFAGRMGATGADPMAAYRSPAGMTPHIMQSTQALMNPMASNTAAGANQPGMASSSAGGGEKKGGGDAPDADVGESFWRILVGACAGGAFIGGFAVATAAPAAAPAAAVVTPAVLTGVLSAAGVGCLLGGATAATSFAAVWVYGELGGP
jgi:hypothetical protein